ncbi:hypothetical protein P3S68_026012 [Capsicum galapagoense]
MAQENYYAELPAGFATSISGYGSRKRPTPHSFDPSHVQHQASSHKQKPSVGVKDRVASLKPSIHQSEAATNAKESPISVVAKSQLGHTNTSPAMHSQPGLIEEVKTEIEDVAPDVIRGGIGEGPLHRIVSPSIQEEGRMTNDARSGHKRKKTIDLSNQPTCNIDVNFLLQVAFAFEEVNANQEESTRSAKKSISMSPSLEPTFLAIVKKHGDITNDCPLESGYMLTSVLQAICKVVQELQQKQLTQFDCDLLSSYYSVVRDAEKMKVNVDWLRTRLDEIKDAVNCIVETKKLNDEKNRLAKQIENETKDLESMNAELEKLQSEIERKQNLRDLDVLLTEEVSILINDRALKIQHFQNMPLMEAFQ